MLKYASIIFEVLVEKRVGEAEFRNIDLDNCRLEFGFLFMKKFHPGEIIVAGENFGCGSSREHAPLALMAVKAS